MNRNTVNTPNAVEVDDFFKATEVIHQMQKQNPEIFKKKFNSMVSDFKLYNFIHERCNGNKETIKSTFKLIGMFDFILSQQLKSKKQNKKRFKDEYVEPYEFTYEKVS